MKTIGIFPASGGLGSSTITHLLNLVPANNLTLINRHPDKVPQAHTDAGVQARKASYESLPSELEATFSGIDTLFLISYPSHVRDYRIKVQLPVINAAHRAGVSHIFYSSLAFAGPATSTASIAEVMQAHLATEAHLRDLAARDPSFTYTIIREGLYAESTPIYTAFFNPREEESAESSEILIPHDGTGPGVAWVKRDELGEASARLIAAYAEDPEGFRNGNGTVLLTGPRVWSLEETVGVLGQVAGREVRIREVGVDEYVRLPKVLGVFGTEEKARTWATAWEAIRAGETAVVTSQLGEILGREPEEFEVTVRRYWGEQVR
ncbi:hypothetical protein B0T25DRAFT_289968 [Lasiosphaeria hispida]|uniref:NmrA-like domain-containing protein n=1 Tax=Lasiosphaeria hispida TaxID=260671 RepID=A0AAJ0MB79_9PEZI|nr:hypothetical protein B0T25DRAFT_289968 [Lasiosphaeria hispida]